MAAVVDPKTGKVLAMGQRPSFDPNKRDVTNYYNDLISYAYEPGSTMKIFTLAAAMQENVFNANEKYKSGTFEVGGAPVKDHNNGVGWGPTTYHDGVLRSSNVAFAKLAKEKLGYDRLNQYLHKFNFYQKQVLICQEKSPAKSTLNMNLIRRQLHMAKRLRSHQFSRFRPQRQLQMTVK